MTSLRPVLVSAVCLSLSAGPLYAQSAPPPAQGQGGQAGQTQQPPPPPAKPQPAAQQPQPPPPASSESLDRIRDALQRPSLLKLENGRPRIYVEISDYWPSFAELSKGYDLRNGPAPAGDNAMSHQEFLSMMRPQELGQPLITTGGGGGKKNLGLGEEAVAEGLKRIFQGKNGKETRKINDQIDRELLALRGGK